MTEQENWKIQAHKRLIDAVLNEIDLEKPPTEVYIDTFYSVTKLGLYFEIIPMQSTNLMKSEEDSKGKAELNQLVIFSLSSIITVYAILFLMRHKNIKKKPKNLYGISFRY